MKHLIMLYIIILASVINNSLFSQRTKIKIDSREVVINYPDSTVKASITLKEIKYKPKTNQVYYWYKSNEIKKNLGGYSGRLLNGKYTVYELEKNMIAEGYFKNGVKTGVWKRWFPKGGLQKIEEFKKGKKDGTFINYLPSGHIYTVTHYKKGKLHGKYTEYSSDTIYSEKRYKKGEEIIPKEREIKESKITDDKEKDTEDSKEIIQKETKEEKLLRKEKEREQKALEKERKQAEKKKEKLEKKAREKQE